MGRHDTPCEARQEISKARESGDFSDLTFLCEGRQISVHRIIVCPQSPVIHAACIGPCKQQETYVYEIKDVSFDIVQKMVEYLYTGRYEVPSSQDPDGNKYYAVSPPVFHAKMFHVADKYLIKGLQSLSMAEFKKSDRQDKDVCAFLRSLVDIYSLECESSKMFRDTVIESARQRLARGLDPSAEEELDEITDQIPTFAKDLLNSFLKNPILGYCTRCGPEKLVQVVPLQCKCKNCGK